MDHKPSNPDKNSWVDDRMGSLDPSPDWNPDADRALDRLTQRKPSSSPQWMRVAMTATILATTVFVLVLLPWHRLWTPKAEAPLATVAAQTGTTPSTPPQSEKPAEKAPAASAPKEPTEAQQAQEAAKGQRGDALLDLPDNEAELLKYLQELAKTREVSAQAASRLSAETTSQTGVTQPVVVHNVLPEYSDEGRQARIQGTVEMIIIVKADGKVQFERFSKTLGYGLDEKAREAVEQWQFTPGKKDGTPVATMISVSTNFSLR